MANKEWIGIYDCPQFSGFATPPTHDRTVTSFRCAQCNSKLNLEVGRAGWGTPSMWVDGKCRYMHVNGTPFEAECGTIFEYKPE